MHTKLTHNVHAQDTVHTATNQMRLIVHVLKNPFALSHLPHNFPYLQPLNVAIQALETVQRFEEPTFPVRQQKNNFNFSKKINKFRSYRPTHPYQHNRVRRRIHEIRTIHSVIQFFVFNFYFLLLRRKKKRLKLIQ